eukprot:Gb_36272 [translate_table: standard]
MTKNKRLSDIMVQDCVKVEDEPPACEIMRLKNLNMFLYKEIMRLRTENKSLMERMDRIKSIANDEPKVRCKAKYKPQGWSLWKSWNAPYHGKVPEIEMRRQHQEQREREYTDTYVSPQIELITPEGVLINEDLLTDAQVSQEDGVGVGSSVKIRTPKCKYV